MWCKTLLTSLGVAAIVAGISFPAHAERVYSSEQSFTLTARVLAHRTVVVDANGLITYIASNTDESIAPEVHFLTDSGPISPMTSDIARQYSALMSKVGANPVFVMTLQKPTLNGLIPAPLVTTTQHLYLVKPSLVGNQLGTSFSIVK